MMEKKVQKKKKERENGKKEKDKVIDRQCETVKNISAQ